MTIFNTPIITACLRLVALSCARLSGWQMPSSKPDVAKGILIGAPHTSNWDFPLMLMAALIMRLEINWIGKHTLFWGPLAPIMRYLGGTAINRKASQNFVDAVVEQFQLQSKLLIVISPEGTRAPVKNWKTGFYFMAHLAQVPIVMSYIDYQKKQLGIHQVLYTSGNAEQEIAEMQAFYQQIPGKHPHNFDGYDAPEN